MPPHRLTSLMIRAFLKGSSNSLLREWYYFDGEMRSLSKTTDQHNTSLGKRYFTVHKVTTHLTMKTFLTL